MPVAIIFDNSLRVEIEARAGDRVAVRFGAQQKIGVVIEDHVDPQLDAARIKPISARRDDAPRLPPDWLALMRFLSGYYQRPLGETVISSLPPRLRSTKPLPKKVLKSEDAPSGTRFVQSHSLTALQSGVVERVAPGFHAYLLHGVTGSGKTEIYLNLVANTIERGEQALVLVPEISLTPQLEARFRHAFPDTALALMHSGLEDIARTGAWLAAARGTARIVLGTRLAVLAPLPRLGLVVVDEEHDASFKQQEGLRYSARDAAVYRAKLAGCPVILGTATPSLESWHNWTLGRYERLELAERASPGARLPAVRTVDMRQDPPEQGLCKRMIEGIAKRLANREQSLIFINRRGYAPVLACEACGWTAGCERCTARMVLHAPDRRLHCHHCGRSEERRVGKGC